jgi:hypothetical protein
VSIASKKKEKCKLSIKSTMAEFKWVQVQKVGILEI